MGPSGPAGPGTSSRITGDSLPIPVLLSGRDLSLRRGMRWLLIVVPLLRPKLSKCSLIGASKSDWRRLRGHLAYAMLEEKQQLCR
jgi:hypothetical protein